MGEVIHEILLDLREEFLAVEIEEAGRQTNQRKEQDHGADDPEVHLLEDILLAMREEQQDMIVAPGAVKNGQLLGNGFYSGIAGGRGRDELFVHELLVR